MLRGFIRFFRNIFQNLLTDSTPNRLVDGNADRLLGI